MKIAYIVPGLDPTGPILVVKNLAEELVLMGHEVDVYYFKDRENAMRFQCNTSKIEFSQILDFDKYDIVHSHCLQANRYVAKNRKVITKAKTVSTIHQDTFTWFSFSYPKLVSFLLTRYWLHLHSKMDAVIGISNQVKNIHQPYLSKPIEVIYNGFDVAVPETDMGKRELIKNEIGKIKSMGGVLLGTFARIEKEKGLDQIISLLEIAPTFHFIAIGDGSYKETLKSLAYQKGVLDRVHLFPFVSAPYACISDIDVYCMPSYSEGFGLALLEAAAMGKAIVCSDLPAFKEIFSDGEVEFFNIHDISMFKNAVDKAYENIDSLSLKAQNKAMMFSKKNMAKHHEEFYNKLIMK